jgi:hypothetical protein
LSVLAGVATAGIAATARILWQRTQVPTFLSQAVDRRSYMRTILELSGDQNVLALEVVSPGLGPSTGDDLIKQIQKHGPRSIAAMASGSSPRAPRSR